MIIDGYEFKMQIRTSDRSIWRCTQECKSKCKVRLATTGQKIQMKTIAHTHERTFKGNYQDLKSHYVTIVYSEKITC